MEKIAAITVTRHGIGIGRRPLAVAALGKRKEFPMRFRFFLILILFCALLPVGRDAAGDQFGRDGNLELLVRSDKPVYKFGEPIILKLKLKNATSETLIVNRRFDPFNDFKWELFLDPVGFVPILVNPPKPLVADDYVALKSGAEIEKVLRPLTEIVGVPLKRGLYGLRLTYINREKPKGPETWTGEVLSNHLSIQIKSGEKA